MSARALFTMEQPAFGQCDDMTVDSCDAGIKFNPNTRIPAALFQSRISGESFG